MYAEKTAQQAYVESLQRMTVEQLIAEVMRVQIAAADLIKQEVANEREACALIIDGQSVDPTFKARMASAIRSRGEESVKH